MLGEDYEIVIKKLICGMPNSFLPDWVSKKIDNDYSKYEKYPNEVKNIIKLENMKSVAGFQTRNVPHKAHEHILHSALNQVDGLFIQPLIGKKKSGDFTPDSVMSSYTVLKDNFLLFFLKKYCLKTSTYRNIGAFFINARLMHV